MSNFNASKMVVALALCLLLLGVFSVEGARIDAACHYSGQCVGDIDCTEHCGSQGYSRGSCKIRVVPSSKVDQEIIHVDYDMPGNCCCLH
ncbi:hypothetical protein MKW92_007700 [Papaver armeniacum]|nr:hypothetical protein MKW92_007700 [Papaver armeniacum]